MLYRDYESDKDVTALVAGYSPAGHSDGEAWWLSELRPGDPRPCKSYEEHQLCLCPRGPPAHATEGLFRDPDYDPDGPHKVADQPSAAIVELLATNLPRMVAEEPEQVFDLIGGQWQILVLSPGEPAGEPRIAYPLP